LVLALLTVSSVQAAPTLADARQRWLKGNYDEAQTLYEDLVKSPKTRSPATIGLSRALESQGEYDKALAVVESALKALPKDANLLARKAEVLYLRGRWDEAEKAADAAVKLQAEHFQARWVRAQVYRDRGDVKKAETECRWFVRTYSARSDADKDIKDPEELLLVGLAGCENARWKHLSDQFGFILNEVYKDALKSDPNFWPVEYHAGLLLLEKYNRAEALDALDNALKINPNSSEALTARGVAELARFEVKEAERFAERALKFNPHLPEALRLRADVHLATGNAAEALKELQTARKINPRDERTLARIATCYHLQKKKAELDKLIKEVEKYDSKPALFFYELAERLEERRRYNEAETYYTRANKLRPNLAGPLNGLGLLYMRLAREEEAAPLLDKGYAADSFNVRVSNMRKVLRHLQKYKSLKTEHFHIRYDPKLDSALANYMAEYLEEIYTSLARQFDYRPKGPILIEVFNNHDMFSGRTVALPDLHTIGACTGRMITMVSPNGKGIPKIFNWARVMRHELVHIFNLEQTNFLVPHWLTEGLAVSNEGFPRPQIWNQLLRQRVRAGNLLNLETIDLGFIRPRNPAEWQLAYCQSQLYVEYIKKEYGQAAIGKLLAAYADGVGTTEALARACNKVDRAAFEKGYLAHVKKVVRSLGGKKATEKPRTLAQLRAEYKKNPENADLAAELALRVLPRSRVEARKLAQEALKNKKNHPIASHVLARLASLAGDEERAKSLLEKALDKNDPEPLVLRPLGKVYYEGGEFRKAAEVFELGRKAQPFDREWMVELVKVYAELKDRDRLISVLKDLVPTDADDFDRRARLSRLLLETRQYAEAERYARQALEIDITDKEVRETLYKALEGQKKEGEAKRIRALLGG
jgi:tetratricopeptide (TPR) repeat protein